jgi:hypothetical protein
LLLRLKHLSHARLRRQRLCLLLLRRRLLCRALTPSLRTLLGARL